MAVFEAATTAAASKVIGSASESILKRVAKKISSEVARIRVSLTETFQNHLESSLFRATYIKTVVSKDKPVKLRDIYVNLTLSSGEDEPVADNDLNPTAHIGSRHIVSGTGGAGKTVLMKYLLLEASKNDSGIIPLFVELRNLDFTKSSSLSSILFDTLHDETGEHSLEMFEAGLEYGLFSLFFDGFDEINPEYTGKASKLIAVFSRRYKSCSIILSTRPGTGIHALANFTVYHVDPLSKEQAVQLVKKTRFDEVSKGKFISALEKDLYDKHRTMMSIPILIVMMLLTFRSYGEIPDRMTVFYSQAFDTLYSIHDAEGKESYKRVHDSGLPPDIFRKVLNAFCYSSLRKYEIEFSRESLNTYVQKGIEIAQADCTATEFCSDLIKNVCVLQPEGTAFVFVHRSFQEFFAASFLSRYSGKKAFLAYDQLISVTGPDIIQMLGEIDRAKFERQWVLPKLEKYLNDIEEAGADKFLQLQQFGRRVVVRESGMSFMPPSSRTHLLRVGMLLAYATDEALHPARIFSQVKFGPTAKKNIKRVHGEFLSKNNISGDRRHDRFAFPLAVNEDNRIIFEDSDIDKVFLKYKRKVKKALDTVRARVENDVVLEDVLFD